MLIKNGLEFLAALALINVAVTLFCKKFPSKIYKYVPPVLIMFLIIVCCNTFGVWTMENESVNNTRVALTNYAIPFLVFLIGAQTDVKRMLKIVVQHNGRKYDLYAQADKKRLFPRPLQFKE